MRMKAKSHKNAETLGMVKRLGMLRALDVQKISVRIENIVKRVGDIK
jgi:hypothetical protein